MKKAIVLVFILSIISTVELNAQTEKSTLLLGGSVSFQSIDNSSFFNFNPNVGLFLKDKFAIGLQATVISNEVASAWSLGPYARLYFGKNEKGKPFGQVSLNFNDNDGSDLTFGGGLTGGYSIFINKSVAVEMVASYHRIWDTDVFGLGVGFQIHFARKNVSSTDKR